MEGNGNDHTGRPAPYERFVEKMEIVGHRMLSFTAWDFTRETKTDMFGEWARKDSAGALDPNKIEEFYGNEFDEEWDEAMESYRRRCEIREDWDRIERLIKGMPGLIYPAIESGDAEEEDKKKSQREAEENDLPPACRGEPPSHRASVEERKALDQAKMLPPPRPNTLEKQMEESNIGSRCDPPWP